MIDSFQAVAEFVASAFAGISGRLGAEEDARAFLEELGWTDLPSVPAALLELGESIDGLADTRATLIERRLELHSGEASEPDVTSAVATLAAQLALVMSDLQRLEAAFNAELPQAYRDATGIAEAVEKRIYDSLVFEYLDENFSFVVPALLLLGVLEETAMDPDPARHQPAFRLRRVELDRLSTILSGPEAVMAEVYGWGTPVLDEERLFANLDRLSKPLLWPSEVRFPSPNFFAAVAPDAVISDDDGPPAMLVLSLATSDVAVLSLGFLALPKASPDEPQGLGLYLVGTGAFSEEIPVGSGVFVGVRADLDLVSGAGAALRPDAGLSIVTSPDGVPVAFGGGKIVGRVSRRRAEGEDAVRLLTIPEAAFIEADELFFETGIDATSGPADIFVQAGIVNGRVVIPTSGSDSFTARLLPDQELAVTFDVGLGWSQRRGVFFTASGGLEFVLPIHETIGPFTIDLVRVAVTADDGGVALRAGVVGSATLGPITATVDALGLEARLAFQSGNLGPVDLDLGLSFPKGYGILVDAGPVRGGGFLYLDVDRGRYSGVMELSVYGIGVKAFGLVETKLPDGQPGFSFVIVIVAEFTPIQLGFGFTLLGVGGLIGINRTVDAKALGDAARTGSLAHLLFPTNVVQDAPAIIHDLATVFPAARDHFIFGPMAKLGWGTPTLISADIGILLELPGPRIGLVGVLRMRLPKPDFAILSLQLAAAGLLDFPAKLFSLDAGLFDSQVAGYTVTGDMAYRMGFGDKPSFLLSVGGFNPGFPTPPGFPELRRLAVEFGISGNPSLTASGYFALTSNTAQVGAKIELKASGYGIRLNGWLGFDVMFVFSPFSFTASISAGVRVSFHGVGIGVTLRGSLSGPTPWHLKGRVCVSVLWWDACLPIDVTFGNRTPATLPEMNPWEEVGIPPDDARLEVPRLKAAIEDARNWSGTAPPAGFSVVTLSEAATIDRTPIDPMGAATLRQRVVPLNRPLEKFGEYEPVVYDHFDLSSVQLNAVDMNGDGLPDEIPYTVVKDKFAPGHFSDLTNAEKLSQDSYEDMDAGVSVAPELVRTGDAGSRTLMYETAFITETGERVADPPFKITQEQLFAMLERSASALGGVRRAGERRYMLPLDRPKKVTLQETTYVVADACSHVPNTSITPTSTTRSAAQLALKAHLRNNPADRNRFTIIPKRAA